MKTTTININVYEIGDVISIDQSSLKLVAKRESMGKSARAMIIGVNQRLDKLISYKLVLENGKSFWLTPGEQGSEKYVGHIDMGLLFGKGETA